MHFAAGEGFEGPCEIQPSCDLQCASSGIPWEGVGFPSSVSGGGIWESATACLPPGPGLVTASWGNPGHVTLSAHPSQTYPVPATSPGICQRYPVC